MEKYILNQNGQQNFSIFKNSMVEMTWEECKNRIEKGAIVFLPVGIVEAHGPHLDLSADFYLATLNCQFLQQGLAEREIDALIAPPLYWGVSKDLETYPGTFSVRQETMKALIVDTLRYLRSWGVQHVFVQNAHGDEIHIQMIREAIKEVNELGGTKVFFMWDLEIEIDHNYVFPEERKGRYQPDYHAGSIETAQMATFFPEKVKSDIAEKLQAHNSFHPSAYVGDPANYKLDMESVVEFTRADVAVDVLKIEALLKQTQF